MQNTRISLAKPELPQAHNLHLPTFIRLPQISAPPWPAALPLGFKRKFTTAL